MITSFIAWLLQYFHIRIYNFENKNLYIQKIKYKSINIYHNKILRVYRALYLPIHLNFIKKKHKWNNLKYNHGLIKKKIINKMIIQNRNHIMKNNSNLRNKISQKNFSKIKLLL
jgi:hypothetical protein